MPKIKTHKGIAKRVKKTKNGKLLRNKAFRSHILTKKNGKKKRNLRKPEIMDKSFQKKYKKMLPYD
ncbi:MAG: 50S ribosomal protein L35 [bacterium]